MRSAPSVLIDFRKGMEGFAALVRAAMGAAPFCGTVYVFRAKRADRVKVIFWDGTGMVLMAKRLEDGKSGVQDAIMRLSAVELRALLEGLDWWLRSRATPGCRTDGNAMPAAQGDADRRAE